MKRLAILLAVGLMGSVAGCAGNKASGARMPCPAGKLCLEWGNTSDPVSLDPHKTQGTWESRIVNDMLIGLTDNDAEGNVIPGMATSWETSPDGLVWTFHLREAKWSDGVPVTGEDFVYALRRIMDPKTAAEYASLLYFIKNGEEVSAGDAPPTALGVEAPDPRTVRITLKHPAPYILQLAKHQTMYPVPRHMVEKYGDKWTDPEHYVSNGPYKLVAWKLGDKVTIEKNPLYWEASTVCIDRVNFYPTEDPGSAERQVRSGELDYQGLRLNRIAYQKREAPEYVHTHIYLGNAYLPLNTGSPKLRDPRVRKALSMVVDRDFLSHDVMLGIGMESAYNFVPPGIAGYPNPPEPDWAAWPMERRRQEARRLLAEAGYGPKNPLEIEIKQRSMDVTATQASVQNDWSKIGVKTTIITAETQIAYQYYRTGDFEVGDAGWIADYNDPMSFLYLMHSKTGAMNYGKYANPEYDRLLDLADNEPDPKKRGEILAQAETVMMNDNPAINLYFQIYGNLVSPRLTGYKDNISDTHPSRFMSFKDATCKAAGGDSTPPR